MTWVCRHCDEWFRDWEVLQDHLDDVAVRCRIDRLEPAIESAADEPAWIATARRRRDELRECFAALDVPAAESLHHAYARFDLSDMIGPDLPDSLFCSVAEPDHED